MIVWRLRDTQEELEAPPACPVRVLGQEQVGDVVTLVYTEEPEVDWQVGRWWVVKNPDEEHNWCETSDEKEARAAMRPGDQLWRSWRAELTEFRLVEDQTAVPRDLTPYEEWERTQK